MPTLVAAIKAETADAAKFDRSVGRMRDSAGKFTKRLDVAEKRMRRFNKTTGATGLSLTRLIGGFTAFTAIRSSISILSKFEETMVVVGEVAQASTREFKELTETAREFGATTRFSANEAAEGLLFLARAGFTSEQSMAALPATLNLAQVGMMDLGAAADLASNVVSQFGLDAEETARVVDSLVIASNRSNTSVAQAGEAMKFAGTVLANFGVQVEDTANLIGVLGDRGIQATMAGTGLRTAFLKLAAPTTQAQRALAKYNLTVEDVQINGDNYIEVLEKLQPLLKDNAAASQVFGLRQVAVAQTLGQSTDKLRALRIEQEANRGEAERVARAMDRTLVGALKSLRSAYEDVILEGGERGFTKVLKEQAFALTDIVRLLGGTSKGFTDLSNDAKILSVSLGLIFGPFGKALKFAGFGLLAFKNQAIDVGGGFATLGDTAVAALDAITVASKSGLNELKLLSLIAKDIAQTKLEDLQPAGGANEAIGLLQNSLDIPRFLGGFSPEERVKAEAQIAKFQREAAQEQATLAEKRKQRTEEIITLENEIAETLNQQGGGFNDTLFREFESRIKGLTDESNQNIQAFNVGIDTAVTGLNAFLAGLGVANETLPTTAEQLEAVGAEARVAGQEAMQFGQEVKANSNEAVDTLEGGVVRAIDDFKDLQSVAASVFADIKRQAIASGISRLFASFGGFGGGNPQVGDPGGDTITGLLNTGNAMGGIQRFPGVVLDREGITPIAERGPEKITPTGQSAQASESKPQMQDNRSVNIHLNSPGAVKEFNKNPRQTREAARTFLR